MHEMLLVVDNTQIPDTKNQALCSFLSDSRLDKKFPRDLEALTGITKTCPH
ncbi:hypothetical protein CJA_2587 [Cellvibrio japonicus Ueda107]|uniref:Uncharacterized protein n=1 Tax=Cellvibrio japonicus (strain Ueda107) TaxID=498211 RepID=B3PLG7_CELJU|nr:hypothetical protein CJA_2587 [Cellvibrio japonicus Ueda107]